MKGDNQALGGTEARAVLREWRRPSRRSMGDDARPKEFEKKAAAEVRLEERCCEAAI
jgi:hypothetical protein